MGKKMNDSGINKLGKRNTNRRLCAQYTEQIFEELKSCFSSMSMNVDFDEECIENIHLPKDPKWLLFKTGDVKYEIEAYGYHRDTDSFPFVFRARSIYGRNGNLKRIIYKWKFSVGYKNYTSQDVWEMVKLADSLFQRYCTDAFIDELKALALKNHVPFDFVSLEKDDDGELRKLYVEDNKITDDKFGMTYYFIERCCLNALSELDVENNDFWDDDDVL